MCGYDTRTRQLEALRFRGLRPARSVAEAAVGAEVVFAILPSLDAMSFGGLAQDKIRRSMELFSREVMPRFRA